MVLFPAFFGPGPVGEAEVEPLLPLASCHLPDSPHADLPSSLNEAADLASVLVVVHITCVDNRFTWFSGLSSLGQPLSP
ncbi:MAG: hypothetical protein GY913_30865 [Proteobacteria bacterium]|nr:hypothetical protein [Pseudomonadota bacterium]MCP4921319.1 hypothetical protein [Pseudomonadota bacterium]